MKGQESLVVLLYGTNSILHPDCKNAKSKVFVKFVHYLKGFRSRFAYAWELVNIEKQSCKDRKRADFNIDTIPLLASIGSLALFFPFIRVFFCLAVVSLQLSLGNAKSAYHFRLELSL